LREEGRSRASSSILGHVRHSIVWVGQFESTFIDRATTMVSIMLKENLLTECGQPQYLRRQAPERCGYNNKQQHHTVQVSACRPRITFSSSPSVHLITVMWMRRYDRSCQKLRRFEPHIHAIKTTMYGSLAPTTSLCLPIRACLALPCDG